jgi:heme-degrading monooxygenase HmoA
MIVEYIRYKLSKHTTDSLEGTLGDLEAAYRAASSSLDASPHCLGYELTQCVEEQDRYILRIEWDSVEGHLTGFRRAPEFASFLEAIKRYIGQIEEMQHYRLTSVVKNKAS